MSLKIAYRQALGSALLCAALLGGRAPAAPMLQEWQDGDVNAFSSWSSSEAPEMGGSTTLGAAAGSFDINGGAGVAVGGQNAIEISYTGDGATPNSDVFYTTAANLIGNLGSYFGIQADFYKPAADSVGLALYFQTSGGNVWFYDIASVSDLWGTYSAPFTYSLSWRGLYDNAGTFDEIVTTPGAQFASDLATIDRLGLYIVYDNTIGSHTYGIDNFGLTVPEPQTYVVLGMALLSLAFVFRKRITDSLAEARSMLEA